jgi:hypothetical protein
MTNGNDIKDHVGKTYVNDRTELVDNTAPDARETNKNTTVRYSELPEGTRVIRPDTIVTMEFRPNRWNLHVDDNNKVVKVSKG